MQNLKPNGQRAQLAVTLIWIIFTLEILSLISGYFQYDLLNTFANGGEVSSETATANDAREQVIGLLYLLVFVISIITFIRWFRRAYFNLHLKLRYLSYDESMAAKSWFIPFLNLFRPYQIMKELYVETNDLFAKKQLGFNQKLSPNIVGLWWALWLLSGFIGQFVFKLSMKAETIDELMNSTLVSMVNNLIGIPLALITIKLIKDYSNVELLLNEIDNQDDAIPAS